MVIVVAGIVYTPGVGQVVTNAVGTVHGDVTAGTEVVVGVIEELGGAAFVVAGGGGNQTV